jgi:hypothetical protein
MKKSSFLAILILGSSLVTSAATTKLDFVSPTFDSPRFQVHFAFEVKQEKLVFTDLIINGQRWAGLLVFKDGKRAGLEKPLGVGKYDFVLDYAWLNKGRYKVVLSCQAEGSQKPNKFELSGVAPENGGMPGGREGFYRIIKIEEEAGLERKGEIVYLTLTAPKGDIGGGQLSIYDGPNEIPYQVLDKRESVPSEAIAKTHPVTWTYKLAVPVQASRLAKKLLFVGLSLERLAGPRDFTITGQGLGKTIKNSSLALELSPQSGQVLTIDYFKEGIKLSNKAGVIHWNPDVFIPPSWDHSFDWNPPPSFEEKLGEFVYINSRRGPLPHIKDVSLEIKYTLELNAPYFVSETLMTAEKDLGVIAAQNDEMVFSKELFDSLIYKSKRPELVRLPLKEMAGAPFGLVHIAPEDLEWVGLLNTKSGYGFFGLRINAVNGNLGLPGNFLNKAGTYFYAPSDGQYVYWVRPLLYTWVDALTSNQLTALPQGSFFYEKNAYLLLKLGDKFSDELELLLTKLKNPLRVF